MASADQVIQHIRFALEALSERNGQHEFEHIARHFARHRICFNILPATGPVGAGGDHGRDFESFSTFVRGLGSEKFAARGEGKKLVFACSLQKDVTSKVKNDVASIMSGSNRPDIVYFFSSRSIAVATRHKLQEWARDVHQVQLEIIDREALAEQLADADIFWIATHYLSVPLEVFPPLPKADGDYESKKASWTTRTKAATLYSEFTELKRCARYALDDSPQDLPFWLKLLSGFEESRRKKPDWVQVAYEIIVLSIRQTRCLRGQEARIRQYFQEAKKFEYADEVKNAATIAAYAVAAHRMGEIDLSAEEISQELIALRDKVEAGIAKPTSPNQLCHWLDIRGHLSFVGGVTRNMMPNISDALSWWLRVAEQCSNAPAFPVQDFHDELFNYIQLIGDHQTFDAMLGRLRPEIANRTGQAAVADSHFRRAEHFSQEKQHIRAIRELHLARVNWFAEETLEHSAMCSVLVARSYSSLGLNYAAISYALAAGFIVANSPRPLLSAKLYESLASAAGAAYGQGHWCLFAGLVESLLMLHMERAQNPADVDTHEYLQWFVVNLPMALLITQRLLPSHFDRFLNDVRRWGFGTLAEQGMKVIRPPVDKWSQEEFLKVLGKNFTGPPFSDMGRDCQVTWSALGIQWRVGWNNTYETFGVAGECVAFLQIAVAEFAGCDLDVVPGNLYADIQLTDETKVRVEALPDNSVYRWRFHVPRAPLRGVAGVDDYAEQMLICVVEMLRAASVMPSEKFNSVLLDERATRIFAYGFFARRFPELIKYFLPDARFRNDCRTANECPIALNKWKPAALKELEWVNSIHPGFDEAAELDRIRKRYEISKQGLRFTLKRLEGNADFQFTVKKLRGKGWKDWHVLQAMLNAAANYRTTQKLGRFCAKAEWIKVFKEELFSPEKPDSPPVPGDKFSELELEFATVTVVLSTMSNSGLESYHLTPNLDGLREYLGHRWHYWDLDVEHESIFEDGRKE